MSQTLYHGLTAEGFDLVCMETRQVAAVLSAMRNSEAEKPIIQVIIGPPNDKTDARGIAQILRAGRFRPVHMKSRESHDIKALLAAPKGDPQ